MLSFSLCCSVLCITTQQTSVKYEFSLSHTETSVPQHKSHTSVQVVRKQQQFEGVRHGEGDPPPHWGWGSGGAQTRKVFLCILTRILKVIDISERVNKYVSKDVMCVCMYCVNLLNH